MVEVEGVGTPDRKSSREEEPFLSVTQRKGHRFHVKARGINSKVRERAAILVMQK
jgi:hypothetical protein